MKNSTFLVCLSLFVFNVSRAQTVVTEDVHFDYYQNSTDNDLYNHFTNGTGLVQLQTNGITGGCLQTPDSINWGNDNANYCSHYHPFLNDTTVTSLSFEYDSTTVHPASFQRGMTIWLVPYADFNHYITASVTYDKKIELLTYSWSNNPYPNLNLLHHHWYHFVLSVAFLGGATNQVFIKAEVFDLGLTGMSAPTLVNSSSGTINDNILVADTSIQVSTTGTRYGGVSYLDDFHFHGREGATNCINTPLSVANLETRNPVAIYPSPATQNIFIERREINSEEMNICLFDAIGKKLKDMTTTERKIQMDISSLNEGVYFICCRIANRSWNKKIMINR